MFTTTVAHRDKTLPRTQNTSQKPKTHPRIQNTCQNPKHFWILGSVLSLPATEGYKKARSAGGGGEGVAGTSMDLWILSLELYLAS